MSVRNSVWNMWLAKHSRIFLRISFWAQFFALIPSLTGCVDEYPVSITNSGDDIKDRPGFGIYEVLDNREFETDTILQINGARFRPRNITGEIKWKIGTEMIEEDTVYRDNFSAGDITVSMIVTGWDSADVTVDTFTRSFHVFECKAGTPWQQHTPWWGTWKGKNKGMSDEAFTVSWGFINTYGRSDFDFTGLPRGVPKQMPFYSSSRSVTSGVNVIPGFNALVFENHEIHQDWGGFSLNGICERTGNSVTIRYRYNNRPYQSWLKGEPEEAEPVDWVEKTYTGYKVSDDVITQ